MTPVKYSDLWRLFVIFLNVYSPINSAEIRVKVNKIFIALWYFSRSKTFYRSSFVWKIYKSPFLKSSFFVCGYLALDLLNWWYVTLFAAGKVSRRNSSLCLTPHKLFGMFGVYKSADNRVLLLEILSFLFFSQSPFPFAKPLKGIKLLLARR